MFFSTLFSQKHYFKFNVNNKSKLRTITKIISIDNVKGNTVWAFANDKEFKKFKELGYKIENLNVSSTKGKVINMATTTAQMANWDRYPTYEVYEQMMLDFQTNYPSICKLDTIGTTQEGRYLLVLKISDNVAINEAEPEFFYTSTMHGDETTGIVLTLRLADYLLSNYGTDTEATNLVNNFEIYINPAANPDGTYHGGNSTVAGSQRCLSNGDDPNRDFPYQLDNTASTNIETNEMISFAENHHFVMAANFHGGAEVYNYPWDCWTSSENTSADVNWWKHVGRAYVDTARLVNSNYMTSVVSSGVTEGADWYYAYGSRQDNSNWYHHCREVTIELSDSKTLSTDQLPAYWNYNKRSLINYIKEAGYGFNGTVKNTSNEPLDAKIEIVAHDKDNSWVVTDPANGDYYRPIEHATYDVTYSSYGYISQTHSVTVTDYGTTTIKNVVLEKADVVSVTGTVTEAGSGNPIENATIEFVGTSIPTVTTNSNGTYTVENVMEDAYQIKASKSGYTAVIKSETITATNNTVDFELSISNAISFETEVPSIFTFNGNADWTRVSSEAYDGTYSMKSGDISNDESSVMSTTLKITSAGNISFYKKVSSESSYDFLKFYIDDVQQGSGWSGSVGWSQESFAVTTGVHTFKWAYEKDGSTASGDDCAWVDYVEFPEYQELQVFTVSGTITKADGGDPINGATVSIEGTSLSAVSSSDGTYSIANVQEGTHEIKVVADGYKNSIQNVTITSSNHTNINFSLDISNAISFETEVPADFTFAGDADWTRVNDKAYDGTWSMKSGDISDSETTTMQVTKTTLEGTVSFYKFVSCEDGSSDDWDFLKFSIDGSEKGRWDGVDTQWSEASYPVSAGTHTYKWEYIKDSSASSGDDCAWVDYIDFPNDDTAKTFTVGKNEIVILPNPSNGNLFVKSNENINKILIYSITGKLINEISSSEKQIQVSNLHRGIYLFKTFTQNNTIVNKVIVQ